MQIYLPAGAGVLIFLPCWHCMHLSIYNYSHLFWHCYLANSNHHNHPSNIYFKYFFLCQKLSLKLILAHLQKKRPLEHVLRNVIGISLQQDPTHFKHIFKYHTTMTSFASHSTDITPPQCVSTFTCLFITMSFHFK